MKKLRIKITKLFINTLTVLVLAFFLSSGFVIAQGGPSFNDIVEDAENSNPGDPNDDPLHSDGTPGPTNNPPNPNPLSSDNPGGGDVPDSNGDYTLLAPLPNLLTFNSMQTCAFGKYLDLMINIFLGICAVLAMVMIVVGGIEYMTSELVSSKENGKNQITQAIFGLLLALGAWIILNEINPKLLELCLDNLQTATPILQDDRETSSQATTTSAATIPEGPVEGCPGGIATVSTKGGNITGCKSIIYSVQSMINIAWVAKDPIKLSGGGFRTREQQIERRIANCGAGDYNIFHKPSRQCSPPTAIPGTSRHERGLAFDLTCEGELIQNKTNKCFIWLKKNAGYFKLKNFPKEPWHWSTDGK